MVMASASSYWRSAMQMDAVSGRYIVHESQLEKKCRRLNCERTCDRFQRTAAAPARAAPTRDPWKVDPGERVVMPSTGWRKASVLLSVDSMRCLSRGDTTAACYVG